MHCAKCGTIFADWGAFCPECGTAAALHRNKLPAKKAHNPPARQLAVHRSLLKFYFLGILTLGIYDLVILCRISGEINLVAQKDGKKTMHFLAVLLLSLLSLFVVPFVWWHRLCRRMNAELTRRGIDDSFGARYFWLLNVLGGITFICPLIFMAKFLRASNRLNRDYNRYGI